MVLVELGDRRFEGEFAPPAHLASKWGVNEIKLTVEYLGANLKIRMIVDRKGLHHDKALDQVFERSRLDAASQADINATVRAMLDDHAARVTEAPPATPVAAAAPQAASKEVTGTITPSAAPAQAAAVAASKADAKPEVGSLPVVDSWVLQDVSRGGALIEGRQGVYEVYAGDVVPGLGRIDAVRRQDGRWVVVTSRGLIVAR